MTRRRYSLDRRSFLRLGAVTTGMTLGGATIGAASPPGKSAGEMRYRALGGTGLEVSEIGFGTYGFNNPALLSAALDAGINLVCTCADYQDGRAEEAVGQAIAKIGSRRNELIVFTGTKVGAGATKDGILATLEESLRRLGTDRVEVFRTHNVGAPEDLRVDELYEAFAAAKKEGKALHLGLSGHQGGLQDCLNAAIESGPIEVFLCKYDFASYPEQQEIFARAAQKGIGTIAFKVGAGERKKEIKDLEAGGLSFTQATVKWALANPNVSSVCAGITNFDQIDEFCGAVGSLPSRREMAMLQRYADEMHDQICRFCTTCEAACPQQVAVADIMRFAMYFKYYGREKDAMQLYASLPAETAAAACHDCSSPCRGACPFGRQIREGLVEAHQMLSLPLPSRVTT